MKTNLTIKEKNVLERLFNIKKKNNTIDLRASYSVRNGKVSELQFNSEIYKVTFCTKNNQDQKVYDLYLTSNELICEEEIEYLKQYLGIEIFGDGSLFEVFDFENDFTLQFDKENSSFINSEGVENGLIQFVKIPMK
ncbi:hypothetical protein ABGT15_04710 [Flavobacterium enshiense]|uniref:hypothetical protein n=1 Tax=Flavobacterium enshiense TaxID=1341165 RepID=UPI00345C704C